MSEYSGIRGTRVKYLASDPTLNTSTEGQVWYNSTSGTLKSLVQIKAWSSGGSMGTARYGLGGLGTQTAALGAGGYIFPGGNQNATEEYNGYSWSSGGNLGTTRRALGGAGTQTAGLVFGGITTTSVTATEEYDGSAWTAGGSLNSARSYMAGCGTQTLALGFGPSATEEYDGSTWTSSNALNITRQQLGGAGIQTAAVGFGGFIPGGPVVAFSYTEEYDGTNWSSVNNMNTARWALAGAGVQTSALGFGGVTPALTGATEEYDGTNWTNSPASLATARRNPGGAGSRPAALAFSGLTTTQVAVTEEYVSSIDAYSPSTVGAWASGGALPTATNSIGSFGSQTAALAFNGEIPGPGGNTTQQSLSYDGTTWTATNPTGPLTTSGQGARGAGTQAQGIASSYQGGGGTPAAYTDVKEWDGTNWTTGTSHSNRQSNAMMAAAGTQTSTAIFGGSAEPIPGPTNVTEEWNGSAWTAGGSLNTARANSGGSGTLTSAICVGSDTSPFTIVEEYNGTSWTTATAYPSAPSGGMRSTGLTQDATLAWHLGTAATWDGAAWTTQSGLATPRTTAGGAGSVSLGLAMGGITNTTATEEWTGGSPITPTGAVASTLTTS